MPDLRAALTQCPIVAILRGVKPDEIDAIGDALVEAGITVIEVRSIRQARSRASGSSPPAMARAR